jgi:RNA polymerase sigma factor for flagellar operon FliA
MNRKERDRLILKYTPLVKNIVSRMTAKLPIDQADKESFINVGMIGLMGALDKYDQTRNVQFETFAKFRIRGAVLDELRAGDWVPRSVRDKDNKLEKAFYALQKELGRPPDEEEVAAHLGIDLDEYFRLLDDTKYVGVISVEDLPPDYLENYDKQGVIKYIERQDPFEIFATEELRDGLRNAIDNLPKKERLVVSLYYYDECTMKEIGKILELTESRVCQLHSQAMLRLRGAVKNL